MGLGRSVGFTDGVRRALGRDKDDAEDFDAQLAELLGWFRGTSPTGAHAPPGGGAGRPAVRAGHGRGRGRRRPGGPADGHRGPARPRPDAPRHRPLPRPGSALGVEPGALRRDPGTVAVAGTPEAARRLLVPEAWSMTHARTWGSFPLPPAEEVEARTMTAKERDLYDSGLTGHIAGTEEQVADEWSRSSRTRARRRSW